MWESWSKNLKKELFYFIDPAGGTTVLNANYQPVYTPATPIVIEGVMLDLTTSELSVRQQLQDSSKQKIVVKDTAEARTILHSFIVKDSNDREYKIGGKPKHPRLPNSLVTVYVSKK